MAISHHATGSWAYAASGSVTPTLPTHAAGDMLIARVAFKSSAIATCSATTASSGWAKIGQTVGATNSGNGTGSVGVAAFWKIAASASDTAPTIDFSQTVTQVGHVAISYQKAAGESWTDPVGDGGLDEGTANTSHSATIASHVSVTSGDMVDFFTGIRDDCTMTVPTITQTGVTFDTVSEQPAAAGTDTGGADGAYDGGYRLATSGTSSAAAVVTGTLSTSEQGTSWMTRLRVNNNQLVTPTTASLTTATFAPTVTATQNQLVTPTTASLTTSAFAPTVTASDHKTVTPTTASLTVTGFAPSVTIGVNVVPTTASLTLSTFAPTVTAPALVTPTTASLTLSTFAPTVSTPVVATPTTKALTITTFAPTVTASEGNDVTVTPTTASLTLSTFAPTVTAPALVTPSTASLTLTTFAPTVTAPALVVPTTVGLTLLTFAPTVSVTENVYLVPGPLGLTITTFAPTVTGDESDEPAILASIGRATRRRRRRLEEVEPDISPLPPVITLPPFDDEDEEDALALLLGL